MSTGLHPPPPLSSATQPAAEAGGVDPATHDKFILVGLHTCGDLGPTMFRVFSQCDQMVGLASVGCCYMKLTCPSLGLSQDGEGTLLQEACSQDTGSSQDGEGTLLQEACSQDTTGSSQDGEGTLLQEACSQDTTGSSQDGEGTLLQEACSQDTGSSQDGEGTLLQEACSQDTELSQDGEGTLLQEACSQDTGLHHVPERPQMTGLSRSGGDSGSSRSSCGHQGADLLHAPERLQVLGNRKSSGDSGSSDVDLQLLKLETGVFHGCSETTFSVDTNCSLSAQMEGMPVLQDVGYPLSEFVRSLPSHGLSYEAREMACHAIETYRKRLQGNPLHLFLFGRGELTQFS